MADTDYYVGKLNEAGNRVFMNPKPTMPLKNSIAQSVRGNTFRGFHKQDSGKFGASKIFRDKLSNRPGLLSDLNALRTRIELDKFSDDLTIELREELKGHIKEYQLQPYNKVRKIIDLYVEHIVALCSGITERNHLIPVLFIPLDSWIMSSEMIFPDVDLRRLKLKRNFTYSSIDTHSHYCEIQEYIQDRAKNLDLHHPIYFDNLWNHRYCWVGDNIISKRVI